jgi:hypothetical protein
VITVHTDIFYSEVDPKSVYLIVDGDSVAIRSWKADNQRYFVAKFSMNDIKMLELDTDEFNTFTLVGETRGQDEETFCGDQQIMIIEIIPQGEPDQEENQVKEQEREQEQKNVREQEQKQEAELEQEQEQEQEENRERNRNRSNK